MKIQPNGRKNCPAIPETQESELEKRTNKVHQMSMTSSTVSSMKHENPAKENRKHDDMIIE